MRVHVYELYFVLNIRFLVRLHPLVVRAYQRQWTHYTPCPEERCHSTLLLPLTFPVLADIFASNVAQC